MTHWQDDHARTHDCRSMMMMMIHEHDFRNLKPDSESHSTTSTSSSTGTVTMISSAARAAAVPPRPQARAGAAQWHCQWQRRTRSPGRASGRRRGSGSRVRLRRPASQIACSRLRRLNPSHWPAGEILREQISLRERISQQRLSRFICKWDQYNFMYNIDQFSHILTYIDNFEQHVQF